MTVLPGQVLGGAGGFVVAALLLAFSLWLALVAAEILRLARGPREELVVLLGEGGEELEFFLRRLAKRAGARPALTGLVVVAGEVHGPAQKVAAALGEKLGFTVLSGNRGAGGLWEGAGGEKEEAPGRGSTCNRRLVDARGLAGKELLKLADQLAGPQG